MVFGILFFWLALSGIVGVAANTRQRNPIGWFFLSVMFSPVLAGLLLLALPSVRVSLAVDDPEVWRDTTVGMPQPREDKFVGLTVALLIGAVFAAAYFLGR